MRMPPARGTMAGATPSRIGRGSTCDSPLLADKEGGAGKVELKRFVWSQFVCKGFVFEREREHKRKREREKS